ncbi:hypothetical protein [Pseudomonas sp. CC120222-01a]|uniref:hypothetical protein n=1 Tax=Pseudomonas sp. CC120222-01a TaxID=1378075 RepID=UPI000DA0F3A9|nr:hypothetical protein [Pseudomonas sp. CC120222-01a]PVZ39304.1 hypothetical protein N430_03854 [Pseudomonas sp. CC120222-01a]
MIDDEKLAEILPSETTDEGEPVEAEVNDPNLPLEPETEEPKIPVGPIDPQGPLARLFREGKGGRDLNDEEFAAFEQVKLHVHTTFMTALAEHGLDDYQNMSCYVYNANGDKSSLRTYLIWALIAGKLEKSDIDRYEFDGTLFTDDESNLWAAVEETFLHMLKMDPIV